MVFQVGDNMEIYGSFVTFSLDEVLTVLDVEMYVILCSFSFTLKLS